MARSRKQQEAWEARQEARIQGEFVSKVERTALRLRERHPDLSVERAFREAQRAVQQFYPGRTI